MKTLSEIRDELHENILRTEEDDDLAEFALKGFDVGVTEFSKLLRHKINTHMSYYGVDIFPEDSTSLDAHLDAHAAKMGRHMCKVFLEYIEECKI